MAAYRSELPHDGVHGVSFGNAAPSPHPAPSAPLLAPLLASAAHLVLVLALLSPLWLTALYAWQRAAARSYGSLRGWQDATPPAYRGLLLPLKALVWSAARHVDSRLPPRLSQARGHALVPSEEEAADVEAAGTDAAGTDPAAASWHAGMLAALAPTYARATEAVVTPPASTGTAAAQPTAACLPPPAAAATANAGAGRRRMAREPQTAGADLEQSPMGTQLALDGVAAIEAAEEDRAAAAATAADCKVAAKAAAAAAAVAAAAAAERDAAAAAASAAADAATAVAAERELAAATAAAAAEKAERDVAAKKREAENYSASRSLGMAFLD